MTHIGITAATMAAIIAAITDGTTEDGIAHGITAVSTTHGTTEDGMTLGTTEVSTILGIIRDIMTHGITADITIHGITDMQVGTATCTLIITDGTVVGPHTMLIITTITSDTLQAAISKEEIFTEAHV